MGLTYYLNGGDRNGKNREKRQALAARFPHFFLWVMDWVANLLELLRQAVLPMAVYFTPTMQMLFHWTSWSQYRVQFSL
jgi:hypothetical protein